MPLKKLLVTYMPQKSFQTPVCHELNFCLPVCHSVHFLANSVKSTGQMTILPLVGPTGHLPPPFLLSPAAMHHAVGEVDLARATMAGHGARRVPPWPAAELDGGS
jgi:hypothetical protein